MNPPTGSKIKVTLDRGTEKIIAPHGSSGVMRYFIIIFLMVWLGGWAVGWVSAFSALMGGKAEGGGRAFLLFWLAGWSVGGVFAFFALYQLLRPSAPEEYVLQYPELGYDSGTPPFTMSFDYRSQMNVWRKLLRKRAQEQFSPSDLRTLKLREFESGNRLTIDKGSERIELGSSLSEIEREWLYRQIIQKYRIEQVT